ARRERRSPRSPAALQIGRSLLMLRPGGWLITLSRSLPQRRHFDRSSAAVQHGAVSTATHVRMLLATRSIWSTLFRRPTAGRVMQTIVHWRAHHAILLSGLPLMV